MSTIMIIRDIDNDAFRLFDRKLSELEALDDNQPVLLHLMSDGGSAYTALAFLDRMADSRLTINVRATGLVASAATLILAAGDHRTMTANAWVMVHEDEAGVEEGSRTSSLEATAAHARRLENQWNRLMAHYTKLTAEEWSRLDKAETFLTAAQCLEYGLIDEVK